MFAKSGHTALRHRNPHPDDVAKAVIRVVEHDIDELDAAPLSLRLGAAIGRIAPKFAVRAHSRLIGDTEPEGHRDMR